jgi:hypothetical protein
VAVAGGPRYALPFLDLRQDDVDELSQKVQGIIVLEGCRGRHISAFAQAPADDVVAGLVCDGPHVGDGLQDHAGDVHVGAVLLGLGNHGVDDYFCDSGNVAEGARLVEEPEDLTLAAGPSQWAVLVVWRLARPFSQALLVLGGAIPGGIVLVGEGEEVCGDGALVGLLEAGQAEGAGLEFSRRGVRDWRRLVGMERAAVVFGRAVLVSGVASAGAPAACLVRSFRTC